MNVQARCLLTVINNLNVMRQSAYLVFNPIMVDNYVVFFNYTPVSRASDSMMVLKAIHYSWLGPELLVCCLAHRGSTGVFHLLRVSVSYSAPRDLHRRAELTKCCEPLQKPRVRLWPCKIDLSPPVILYY